MKIRALFITSFGAAAMALAGCAPTANFSGDIKDEAADVGTTSQQSGVVEVTDPSFSTLPDESVGATGGLLDSRIVFFEYDKAVVKEEDLPTISAHADYLNSHPAQRLILEGNADERGSNEYNLALGQRRADAVRDILFANGVGTNQIETLSFGEENPRVLGSSENAWTQNRRVEFRYHNE